MGPPAPQIRVCNLRIGDDLDVCLTDFVCRMQWGLAGFYYLYKLPGSSPASTPFVYSVSLVQVRWPFTGQQLRPFSWSVQVPHWRSECDLTALGHMGPKRTGRALAPSPGKKGGIHVNGQFPDDVSEARHQELWIRKMRLCWRRKEQKGCWRRFPRGGTAWVAPRASGKKEGTDLGKERSTRRARAAASNAEVHSAFCRYSMSVLGWEGRQREQGGAKGKGWAGSREDLCHP